MNIGAFFVHKINSVAKTKALIYLNEIVECKKPFNNSIK